MLKKKLTALVATLVVLGGMTVADAGIFYGNGIANRVNGSRAGFLFRGIGNLERRKDIWIFGRPLGESRSTYQYSQPRSNNGYYYQNGTYYYQNGTYYYQNSR